MISPATRKLSFENTAIAFADKSDKELRLSYRLFRLFSINWLVSLGTKLTPLAFQLRLPIKGLIRKTIFGQFCGGETLWECSGVIQRLGQMDIETMLDYGVEAKDTEAEYEKTVEEVLASIKYAKGNEYARVVSTKVTGWADFDLLKKLHAGKALDAEEQQAYERVKLRMNQICMAAEDAKVEVFFDAEESWIQKPIDDLIEQAMRRYNRDKVIIYNTFQLYRTDRLLFLQQSHDKARREGYLLGAKLVRGAYMEKERERAKRLGYTSPIHPNKDAVNHDYNAALDFCLDNIRNISVCAATHNEESCLYFARQIEVKGISHADPHVFFAQLYGMGENISYNLADAEYRVVKLIPYGPVKEVVPYLIRRAQENSSTHGQVNRELTLLQKEMERRRLA